MTSDKTLTVPLNELEQTSHGTAAAGAAFATTLEECERAHILYVLNETGWVIGGLRGGAKRLGLKRTTLISKMKKLGLARKPKLPIEGS